MASCLSLCRRSFESSVWDAREQVSHGMVHRYKLGELHVSPARNFLSVRINELRIDKIILKAIAHAQEKLKKWVQQCPDNQETPLAKGTLGFGTFGGRFG